MLSNDALKGWLFIGFIFMVIAIAKAATSKHSDREIVDACFKKNIVMCGDLICEGEDERPTAVLKAMKNAMDYCFDSPELIGEEWFK